MMFMESKTKRKSAASSPAINDSDHWNFLEEIEAPMWADLSVCDSTNDETDDSWFNISHEFHQCSSRQLISTVFGSANSINIQEPTSPKLPASVSKSRGKNYKIKQWEQRKGKAIPNKQHPVKTLTKGSSISMGSKNKMKPISKTGKTKENQGVKACSSGGSNTSELADNATSKSSSVSIGKREDDNSSSSTLTSDHSRHQEKKCFEVSFHTSSQSSKLLSSLKINLRKSCATRPAARVVVADGERCSEGGSSNSSVGPPSIKKYSLGDAQNKLKTLKAPALTVGRSSNIRGSNMLASKVTTKGKVQQPASVGKVSMPRNINKQNRSIGKENERVGIGRRTASLAIIKETTSATMATSPKDKSNVNKAQPIGHVHKASKERMTQKNGAKKPIGLKEKTANISRDKDTAKLARKVYFR
ncbi:hypothetical protein HanPI659440_Chr03g0120331 [Helianthus annuus]|nr:hypothetical protein HanPI659440_Chr03g0120331 [Helianthus annuus]